MDCGMRRMARVGKKKAGRLLDGCTWDQMPTDNGPLSLALGAGGVEERGC
jgi:hypothetical protein